MKNKQIAFTLIELLVVIVIIGILATISTATFNGSVEKAKEVKLLTEWIEDQKRQEANCVSKGRQDCDREIIVGTQIWARYNANVGKRIDLADRASMSTKYGTEKVCYDNSENNCYESGGLYSYEAAQGVCPTGWDLPTEDQFTQLIASLGGGYNAYLNNVFFNKEDSFKDTVPGVYSSNETYTNSSGFRIKDEDDGGMYFIKNDPDHIASVSIGGSHTFHILDIAQIGSDSLVSVRCIKK